jgi:hypothetical protein
MVFLSCPVCRCTNITETTTTVTTRTVVYGDDNGQRRIAYRFGNDDTPDVQQELRCVGCGTTLELHELVDALVTPLCPHCGPDSLWEDEPGCGECGYHTLLCLIDRFDPDCPCNRHG